MKHALLAAVAVAALAFPGLAATATNKTHAPNAAHAASAKALPRPVHQMLGAQLPFIKTGPKVGQGYILRHKRSPRPQVTAGFADGSGNPNNVDNLTYGNPDQIPPKALAGLPTVMTYNTNYTIFWIPNGYRTASNYISVINQYFNDLAADSYSSDNVDSASVQYMGAHDGEIYYDTQFGGFAIDTNPFPKSACMGTYAAFASSTGLAQGHLSLPGINECLSDAQIETEVKKFADSQGWDHGPNTEFFMYTPHNVGSCFFADGKVAGGNLNNVCSYDWYCAYHSEFGGTTPDSEYIYANMPWPNQAFKVANGNQYKSDCDGGEHPNGTGSESNGTDPNGPTDLDAADEVLGVTSHEHNESTTDPTGYGWWDDNPDSPYAGYENGDLCAWYWASDGSSYQGVSDNNSDVTDTINGHSYFTQGEWSNADATSTGYSGCVWDYTLNQPGYTMGTNALTGPDNPGAGSVLTLTAGDFGDGPGVYTYVWYSCSPDEIGLASRRLSGVSLKQLKAKNFTLGNGCNLVGLDFSNSATSDTYTAKASDVSNDIIGGVFKDNGSGAFPFSGEFAGGDFLTAIPITGEPEVNGEGDPFYTSPTSMLLPGAKVNVNLGTWTNTPLSFSVQWQHCVPEDPDSCTTFKTVKVAAKAGTGLASYVLGTSDVHWAIQAVVTASNKAGTSNFPGSTGLTDEIGGYPVESDGAAWNSDSPVVGTPDQLNFGTWTVPTGAPITGWTITVKRCPLVDTPDYSDCETAATLTAKPPATSVSYTPVVADVGQTLVAYLAPKNKYGTGMFSVYTASTVGGNPVNSVAPTFEQTSAVHGATVTLDMGTWSPAATQYRVTVYACTDAVVVSSCTSLGVSRTTNSSAGFAAPDEGGQYYLRASVQAINGNGYSDDAVWTDNAVDVDDAA